MVVAAVAADTCLNLAAAQEAACTYAKLMKQQAAEAVRKRDMQLARRSDKSTVYRL